MEETGIFTEFDFSEFGFSKSGFSENNGFTNSMKRPILMKGANRYVSVSPFMNNSELLMLSICFSCSSGLSSSYNSIPVVYCD